MNSKYKSNITSAINLMFIVAIQNPLEDLELLSNIVLILADILLDHLIKILIFPLPYLLLYLLNFNAIIQSNLDIIFLMLDVIINLGQIHLLVC